MTHKGKNTTLRAHNVDMTHRVTTTTLRGNKVDMSRRGTNTTLRCHTGYDTQGYKHDS